MAFPISNDEYHFECDVTRKWNKRIGQIGDSFGTGRFLTAQDLTPTNRCIGDSFRRERSLTLHRI
jgi:hypothetical protein